MNGFTPLRIAHEFTQRNLAPPEQVFPLLCPVREAEWIPGWRCRLIHSTTGLAELGCIFATPNPDGTEKLWVISEYEPPRRIAFVWVWPEMVATLVSVELRAEGVHTEALVRYTYTGLSQAGNGEVQTYSRSWFEEKMTSWEAAINHFLRTGQMLEP
jgi:hypothetical protein